MNRKLVGFLLTAIGVIGLVMADINFLEIVSTPSYGNNLYNAGDKGSKGVEVLGYLAAGLLFIFLGIKKLRSRPSM